MNKLYILLLVFFTSIAAPVKAEVSRHVQSTISIRKSPTKDGKRHFHSGKITLKELFWKTVFILGLLCIIGLVYFLCYLLLGSFVWAAVLAVPLLFLMFIILGLLIMMNGHKPPMPVYEGPKL